MANQLLDNVRTKFPGAYDHLDDQELAEKLVAKYPVYAPKLQDILSQPKEDPEVQAIKGYERGRQAGSTKIPAPRASAVSAPFQPADVAFGGVFGGLRGGALSALRTAAEVGAMGPTQAVARPYIEEALPGKDPATRAERWVAEQAVGLAPGLAAEKLLSRGATAVARPPSAPTAPKTVGTELGDDMSKLPPMIVPDPFPPGAPIDPTLGGKVPPAWKQASEEANIPLTEAAARTVRPAPIGAGPEMSETSRTLAAAQQASIYGKTPPHLRTASDVAAARRAAMQEGRELPSTAGLPPRHVAPPRVPGAPESMTGDVPYAGAGVTPEMWPGSRVPLTVPAQGHEASIEILRDPVGLARKAGVDQIIEQGLRAGRPASAIGRDIEQEVGQQRLPFTRADWARLVDEYRTKRGIPGAHEPAALRQWQAQGAGAIEPPKITSKGEAVYGGPPAPLDGKPVFDPDVPPNVPREETFWSRIKSLWSHANDKLPQDGRIAQHLGESPVISAAEQFHVNLTDGLERIVREDIAHVRSYTPDEWVDAEARAVAAAQRGANPSAVLAEFPAGMQQVIEKRQARFAQENIDREYLGLPDIHEVPFPYVPRRVTDVGEGDVRVFRRSGFGSDLATAIGSFGKERVHRTMREGILAGVEYEDPRQSALMREWAGLRLRETANFVRALEGKSLFHTAEEAQAASQSGTATAIRDFVPGGKVWFAPSREEAVFIRHQFREFQSTFGHLVHYGNALFRNPNLVNPFPHFLKNMMAKYALFGGTPTRLLTDMVEFFGRKDPALLERFEAVMPFSKGGQTAHAVLADELMRIKGEGPLYKRVNQVVNLLKKPNQWSQDVIFKWGDPAMRYSLWKRYVNRGLSDQAAANQTWVDLIRYGTRSDVVDFWKAWPLNFFVPWRWGSLASYAKAAVNRPIQTTLLVGAVDYLREMRYRKTGRWTHLPWDYTIVPLMQATKDPKMIAPIAGATALFGPGGAYTAAQLGLIFNDVMRGAGYKRLLNMFWGLGQLFGDVPQEWHSFKATGDTSHLVNMAMTLLMGEHQVSRYAPVRATERFPRSLPGLEWNPRVAAVQGTPILGDAEDAELRRIGVKPGMTAQRVTIAGKQYRLADQDFGAHAQLRSKLLSQTVRAVMADPDYQRATPQAQRKLMLTRIHSANARAIGVTREMIGRALKLDVEEGAGTQ